MEHELDVHSRTYEPTLNSSPAALTRYQQCMQRARLHTHCEKTVELNGHMDSMEQLMLARHESLCSARGNKAYMESEGDAADR